MIPRTSVPLTVFLLTACVSLALIVALVPAAYAQDGGDASGVIDTTTFIEYLLSILATVITAGLMWLVRQGAGMLGINKEAKIVEELRPLIKDAVSYGQRKARALAGDSNLTKIDVENEAIATAVNHILSQAPKWLKQAGITPAMVEGWVESLMDTPERDKARAAVKKVEGASA